MAWPTPTAECRLTKAGVAGRRREAVGHSDDDRLLQAEHVFEVGREVEEERQLGRAGIAEDAPHAERAQQVQHGLADGGRRRAGHRAIGDHGGARRA
jgi:hypothetical protein